MNEYFCKIEKYIQQRIPSVRNNYSTYFPRVTENNFFWFSISVQEIEREMKDLNLKKHPGPTVLGKRFENHASIYSQVICYRSIQIDE